MPMVLLYVANFILFLFQLIRQAVIHSLSLAEPRLQCLNLRMTSFNLCFDFFIHGVDFN